MGKQYQVRCRALDKEARGEVVFNNAVFAVPGLLDGERALISLRHAEHGVRFAKSKVSARLEQVLVPSADRKAPGCACYGACGGCQLLHMTYERQLRWKQECVQTLLGTFGTVRPILGMEQPFAYRNKIHATFACGRHGEIVSGLYRETTHRVVPVTGCLIERPQGAAIMETIRRAMTEKHIAPYHEDAGTGLLRHVLFRVAVNGDVMVVLVAGNKRFLQKEWLAHKIVTAHPEVKTVVVNYNPKRTTLVLGTEEEVLYGDGFLTDSLLGCTFRISPRSFYQVNPIQTERLYETALRYARIQAGDTVVDACCGVGTLALLAAKHTSAGEVWGVELNEDAVQDAKENARRNGLPDVRFVCADMGAFWKDWAKTGKCADVVLFDPPRSGATDAFLRALLRAQPKRVVYISCNPETLARDLQVLAHGYRMEEAQPVDMFAQTVGVECVASLVRR